MSEGKASDEARAARQHDSVYDFLYHDARRTASFLAQMDPAGHLTGLKVTDRTEEGSSNKAGASAQGGLPPFARANANFEDGRSKLAAESSERTYDPLWTNALTLLDYLEDRDMVRRDVRAARIGEFVVAAGSLAVFDLSVLKSCWDMPIVRSLLAGGMQMGGPEASAAPATNRQQRRRQERTGSSDAANPLNGKDGVQFVVDVLKIMPHSLQARLGVGSDTILWCSLREDSMSVASSDMLLKHGVTLGGRWNVLGILDALPEGEGDDADSVDEALRQALGLTDNALGQMMTALVPMAKKALGRPPHAYGITPLLIFREVSAG